MRTLSRIGGLFKNSHLWVCVVFATFRALGAQGSHTAPKPSNQAGDSTDLINPDRPGIADGSRVIQPVNYRWRSVFNRSYVD